MRDVVLDPPLGGELAAHLEEGRVAVHRDEFQGLPFQAATLRVKDEPLSGVRILGGHQAEGEQLST
jgi:hypothetical protein